MKAGRELDALVAEKVTGWERKRPSHCEKPEIDEAGQGWAGCSYCGWTGNWGEADGPHWDIRGYFPKPYSTSIAAAWELVDVVQTKLRFHRLELCSPDPAINYRVAVFSKFGHKASEEELSEGDTAPEAICLAALKAVGYEMGRDDSQSTP
jgi:hypothetical protein